MDYSTPVDNETRRQELIDWATEPSTAEDFWLEWKGYRNLELEAKGEIAREILGIANRDPVRVREPFGGFGYILIGVSSGYLTTIDWSEPAGLRRTRSLRHCNNSLRTSFAGPPISSRGHSTTKNCS